MPSREHMHDRAMSLHRRAFELSAAGGSLTDWRDKARRLDCPDDAVDQIWKTALLAREAGMTAKQAFPLTGDINEAQLANRDPPLSH